MEENKYIIKELEEYQTQFGDTRDNVLNIYNFGSGAQGVIYSPEDVNPNTKITVYYPGQNENKNPLDEFPEFHELYSDETKIVYEHTNGYRLIIHKDGDEIIGIEHYYKFENENLANNAFGELSSKYEFDNNIENIIQKDNYIKVIFKNEMFENLTINDIRNKYKDLNEIREI